MSDLSTTIILDKIKHIIRSIGVIPLYLYMAWISGRLDTIRNIHARI